MGSSPLDLESIREILSDKRTHSAFATIKDLELASDRSVLFALCSMMDEAEKREVVARVSWDACSSDAGVFMFPVIGDLVVVQFPSGDSEQAVITKRMSSDDDTIPAEASDGSLVLKSLDSKKLWMISANKVLLGRGGAEPSENLVLGQILKNCLSQMLDAIVSHTHVGNLGSPTSPPINAADFIAIKASPVSDDGLLSDVAFTEK